MVDRITGRSFATRSEVLAQRAMAATSHPLATQVALDILKTGGTATDAAIAANALLGLVEPTGCGLGGDLFAIVWDGERLHGLNASGRSPRSLTLEHLRGLGQKRIPCHGPLSVSVPGVVDGWYTLHEKLGKLPMASLLAPTIRYAREGFPVTQVIADSWAFGARELADYPGFRETFIRSGCAPKEGEIFKNPALARTLEVIAESGRDAFYRGGLADIMDRFMRRAGGFLTRGDLETHGSEWVEPVSASYRGYDVWELPPNGQGIAALQILNLLEAYDLAAMEFGSPTHVHHFLEAKKLAFEDRAKFYADPDFAEIPVEELISKDYADRRRERLDPSRASKDLEPGDPILKTSDTVYLTTADGDGQMVSLIQSNFRGMGSGLCPDGLGFCFQDRGELFALEDGHANVYAPGKRPFHTIIPAFVTRDGRPYMSFGVMGGDIQPQMHAQILMNHIDFEMSLQESGDAPRIFHTGSSEPTGGRMHDGGEVHLESGFARETRAVLERMGHRTRDIVGGFGGYQAIACSSRGVYRGASESRKDGHAAGF